MAAIEDGRRMNGNGKAAAERHEPIAPERMPELMPLRVSPAPVTEWANPQDYVPLSTHWHTLLRRRWTVFTVAFVLTTIAAVVSFGLTPIYRATARVEVEAE